MGRTVLPKAIREAVHLGKGGPAKLRLAPGGIIQIEPVVAEGRRLKKVGKFLVAVSENNIQHDDAADVRAERDSEAGVRGGAIYDALILACARKATATQIWTLNARHFLLFAPELSGVVCEPA